jgi:hypothetical protein
MTTSRIDPRFVDVKPVRGTMSVQESERITIFPCQNSRSQPPQRRENEIFEKMAGINQNPGAHRSHQGVVDHIDFFWIRIGPGQRGIKNPDREKNVGVFEPPQIVCNWKLSLPDNQFSGNRFLRFSAQALRGDRIRFPREIEQEF